MYKFFVLIFLFMYLCSRLYIFSNTNRLFTNHISQNELEITIYRFRIITSEARVFKFLNVASAGSSQSPSGDNQQLIADLLARGESGAALPATIRRALSATRTPLRSSSEPPAATMLVVLLAACAALASAAVGPPPGSQGKVVCYYDSKSYVREFEGCIYPAQARMLPLDLDPALSFCTHLVYGYAGVQPDTYKAVSLNENLDVDRNHANYRAITGFKTKYPALKVLLSIGGDADKEAEEKYNLLLESPQARTAFVNSAVLLAEQHGFDGVDLAWQFARIKPKKIRGTLGSIWHKFKKTFGTTPVDDKEAEHREGFTALVRELKAALNLKPHMQLAVTVLPNVNATVYYDVPAIINLVDIVNVQAFDYYTPARNPKEADYTAPTYRPQNRNELLNVDSAVNYWLSAGAPSHKIVLGIATYGRTWRLDGESEISGVPPLHADEAGEAGPYTKTEGILSYPEICAKLINPNHQKGMRPHLRKVTDPSKRFGTYAFRLPDDSGEGGLWVSYEDPDTAGQKAQYAKSKALGGVSIVDLSMDDFRGLCTGDKYPLLRAAKYRL